MNGFIPSRRITLLLLALLSVSLAAGCGGSRGANMGRPPRMPPPPPPRQNVAIDPALQEAARREITAAAAAPDPIVRAHAIEAMREGMGESAAEAIVNALDDDESIVRFAGSIAAGELRLAQAKDHLLVLSDDADPSVRVAAKFALHRIGDTRQSRDLQVSARDPSPQIRGDTAMLLGLLGEPSAVKVLMPMLFDANAAVRLQAAEALWRLGNKNGMEALVSASVSRFPDDQMIALIALAGPRDRRALGHIEGALVNEAGYEPIGLVAARAAGMLGSDSGYAVARRGLKSPDPRQRMLAALALGAIARPDAQDDLAPLLRDADTDVRLAAATALLQLK